jgi:branched-chain amino acid transport system ATP-binding protein
MLGTSKQKWEPFKKLQMDDPIYQRALELLDQVGLKHRANMLISEISYGEQRRVEIALAMSQNPLLLLLDEPLAGLSLDERIIVRDLISAIPKTTTIVMIEHDMDVALSYAETISVLHYGSLIVEGDKDFVVNHPRTREVYLGH